MRINEIRTKRFKNQLLTGHQNLSAEDAMEHMLVLQSQEFDMSKWALGIRSKTLNENKFNKLFNEGKILRTHILRPTWHIIAANNIRWLLKLSGPRVNTLCDFFNRQHNLDNKAFKKSERILEKILQRRNFLTRNEIVKVFEKEKIRTEGERTVGILMHAELTGLICSGPLNEKKHTYGLLDELVPAASTENKGTLQDLMVKYFESRGPASLKDFCFWSSMPVRDCKKIIDELSGTLKVVKINEEELYYFGEIQKDLKAPDCLLIPDYDEIGISYRQRGFILGNDEGLKGPRGESAALSRIILINGLMCGTWKKDSGGVKVDLKRPLNKKESKSLEMAINEFEKFKA